MQSFDPEAVREIEQTVARLEEGAISKLPTAANIVAEQAKDSGSGKLIKSTEEFAEVGVANITKAFDEMLTTCKNYVDAAKKYFEATGVEY